MKEINATNTANDSLKFKVNIAGLIDPLDSQRIREAEEQIEKAGGENVQYWYNGGEHSITGQVRKNNKKRFIKTMEADNYDYTLEGEYDLSPGSKLAIIGIIILIILLIVVLFR